VLSVATATRRLKPNRWAHSCVSLPQGRRTLDRWGVLRDNERVMGPLCHSILLLLLVAPIFAAAQADGPYDLRKCDTASSVGSAQAEDLTIEKGAVEIPPLAKATRQRGVVRVEVCVSEQGDVVLAKPVSGPPILIGAAVESTKKWRFKSTQAPFKTVLEISFMLGSTAAELADEQKINNAYFAEEDKCRESLHSKADDALKYCKSALDLVERLPKERFNERRSAYELMGHTYFQLRGYDDALRYYQTELKIALASLHPNDAELAYAYHDVALADHALGRVSEAAEYYAKAEQTILEAKDHIESEFLKKEYAATLKRIREHYLILLHQTGQTAAAADLEKRIQSANN
jgi:Tetratricopeptide repeat/Gram-negative bacterial TonB protein C-terminal